MTGTKARARAAKRGVDLLAAFMDENAITYATAAKALGTTKGTICWWMKGTTRPRHEIRVAIAIWSSNEVTATSWLSPAEQRRIDRVRPWRAA